MARMKICSGCNQYYDRDKPEEHNCKQGQIKNRERNRLKQKEYQLEHKGEQGYELLHSRRWREFRKQVIARDLGMCQRCYAKHGIINDKQLEVHHIKPRIEYPELTFVASNVVTLCKSCNATMGLSGVDFNLDDTYINNGFK